MTIDWSKAPEGATHWDKGLDGAVAGWMRLDEGQWYWWPVDGARCEPKWIACLTRKEPDSEKYIARPSQWTGEGNELPPVGTVCESVCGGVVRRVEILCITESHVFIRDLERNSEWLWDRNNPGSRTFRPIRTPEQIAEEEREQELNRMVATVSMLDKGWARKVCAGLYDAGYRKQVAP